ncbi:hypothetical protein GCM10010168_86490 [Actinoplanes ianthinogenes]|uniref:Uncharacterized protein n=1 Tax=Actinoplanes ianthinogenes TaxID=122358 RepID=A0ABN6CK83_9ACTN|nr:hypothetical protein [Actinoplanes ianthinogenes]BCJ45380.1 hypothetical protein Aiant_60370 [Actinoplanes ianthinogenes]GGR54106.1 hypothetical protein GCM10010168_86490 [Actinoplanes ianthinogenes]
MSLWRRIRAELRGAWRSVKYDLGRRPSEPVDGPDVTSTGLSTFPGSLMEWRTVPPETDAKPPRRFVAVTVLCLVAMLGAVGSYLLVARGLTSAFADQTAADQTAADQAAAAPALSAPAAEPTPPTADATTRMGEVTHKRTTAPHATAAGHQPGAIEPAAPADFRDRPARPRTTTTPPCDCVTPPVPTPTAPSPAGSTPPPDSPAPSDPPSTGASASPGASTDPSPEPTPSQGWRERHRRWQQTG